MKYAFIIGSNAFIVPSGIISYADINGSKEILRVKSLYHDNQPNTYFSVDLNITDTHGNAIQLVDNRASGMFNFRVTTERNSVSILNEEGSYIIHIQQMDDASAMGLEHNITAELEISTPVAAIRIFGDFKAEGLTISAENEKLFINDNGYATAALHGTNQVEFTAQGVVL
jgi:hypothetical protein